MDNNGVNNNAERDEFNIENEIIYESMDIPIDLSMEVTLYDSDTSSTPPLVIDERSSDDNDYETPIRFPRQFGNGRYRTDAGETSGIQNLKRRHEDEDEDSDDENKRRRENLPVAVYNIERQEPEVDSTAEPVVQPMVDQVEPMDEQSVEPMEPEIEPVAEPVVRNNLNCLIVAIRERDRDLWAAIDRETNARSKSKD